MQKYRRSYSPISFAEITWEFRGKFPSKLIVKFATGWLTLSAVGYLIEHGRLSIQDYEKVCPDVNRRSLQRDLKGMVDQRILEEVGVGATDPTRYYVLKEL